MNKKFDLNFIITAFIALIIIVFSFILFYNISTQKIIPENRDIILFILGLISGIITTIASFYFGSSQGSYIKNNMFKNKSDDKDKE